jgi:hypothetical protein
MIDVTLFTMMMMMMMIATTGYNNPCTGLERPLGLQEI